ncbi:unnamed protein product [Pleuronectes platessa]|uniref:CCHC-type domain-containing protein n=1 Tax=Pleuronectes platessa TaxID=8262 RepID=A0A9N7UWF0_PLEPL|nr:unnamed protein product [Pleuronectes platessa]
MRLAKMEVFFLQRLLKLEYSKGNSGGTVNQRACDSLKAKLREVFEGRARAYLLRDVFRCFLQLKTGRQERTGTDQPPASFTIGTNGRYLYYSGQPLYCRKCTDFGHTAESCTQESQEEGEMEGLQVNSDQDVEAAARVDGLEGGEHGQISVQTEERRELFLSLDTVFMTNRHVVIGGDFNSQTDEAHLHSIPIIPTIKIWSAQQAGARLFHRSGTSVCLFARLSSSPLR